MFGTIKEETATRGSTVCGAKERVQHVYTSVSNSIELRIVGKNPSDRSEYFLFRYEGERYKGSGAAIVCLRDCVCVCICMWVCVSKCVFLCVHMCLYGCVCV